MLAAGAGLALLALWLAWPGRNVHGNPSMERLAHDCTLPSGLTARLYEGNGGATTAFWYSVTVEGGLFQPERQVFFAYSEPSVERIACQPGEILVVASAGVHTIKEHELSALRKEPVTFWRGEREQLGAQPLAVFTNALAFLLLITSLLFVVKALGRQKQTSNVA